VDKKMAKLTPEQLKQIRMNNLSKGRMGKGRPKGVKNKITAKKVNEMIIKFLDQQENKNISKSDIINQELKIDLKETVKTNQLQEDNKEQQKEVKKIDKQEKLEEKPKPYRLFDF
jgi:hypothetical protein